MNKLKKYVNWKLTHSDKTAEAEGYPLTMQNCKANKKMKQLEVYGNSVQEGTPTPEAPIEVQSVGETTVNIYDADTYPLTEGYWINGGSGLYNADGGDGIAATNKFIPCEDLRGKTITINHTKGANTGIAFYNSSRTYLSGVKNGGGSKITATVPDDAIYYRFCIDANYIHEAQVQLGSTATPYEPYGKYKIPVVSRGVNLFSMAKSGFTAKTVNGITFTPLGDERIHIKGKIADASSNAVYNPALKVKVPIGKGVYNVKPYSGIGTIMFRADKDKNDNFLININAITTNVNVAEDAYLTRIHIQIKATSTKEWDDIVPIQLTKGTGTKNLAYEPYVEPTSTNIFLNEPLCKIGDYADYVDFKNKCVVRKTSEVFFDGSEDWKIETLINGKNFYVHISNSYGDRAKPVLCNMGLYYPKGALDNAYSCMISPSKNFNFRYADFNNLADFKNKLAEMYSNNNSLSASYILDTPTQEPITCELPKLNGKTSIIEVDTSIVPSNAYGKYIRK